MKDKVQAMKSNLNGALHNSALDIEHSILDILLQSADYADEQQGQNENGHSTPLRAMGLPENMRNTQFAPLTTSVGPSSYTPGKIPRRPGAWLSPRSV